MSFLGEDAKVGEVVEVEAVADDFATPLGGENAEFLSSDAYGPFLKEMGRKLRELEVGDGKEELASLIHARFVASQLFNWNNPGIEVKRLSIVGEYGESFGLEDMNNSIIMAASWLATTAFKSSDKYVTENIGTHRPIANNEILLGSTYRGWPYTHAHAEIMSMALITGAELAGKLNKDDPDAEAIIISLITKAGTKILEDGSNDGVEADKSGQSKWQECSNLFGDGAKFAEGSVYKKIYGGTLNVLQYTEYLRTAYIPPTVLTTVEALNAQNFILDELKDRLLDNDRGYIHIAGPSTARSVVLFTRNLYKVVKESLDKGGDVSQQTGFTLADFDGFTSFLTFSLSVSFMITGVEQEQWKKDIGRDENGNLNKVWHISDDPTIPLGVIPVSIERVLMAAGRLDVDGPKAVVDRERFISIYDAVMKRMENTLRLISKGYVVNSSVVPPGESMKAAGLLK